MITRRRKGTRFIGKVLLLTASLTLASIVVRSQDHLSARVTVEGQLVCLVLKDLFGVEQKLSGYRGKIVVLNFWATWCIPCRKEMPDLAAIQNDYAALGVQVIGAAADTLADRSKVLQFVGHEH